MALSCNLSLLQSLFSSSSHHYDRSLQLQQGHKGIEELSFVLQVDCNLSYCHFHHHCHCSDCHRHLLQHRDKSIEEFGFVLRLELNNV